MHKEIINQQIDRCQIHVIGGNITVLAGLSHQASINVQCEEDDKRFFPKFFVQNNVLKVEMLNWKAFIGQKKRYNIEVVIPGLCPLDVTMFAGTINLEGLSGSVDCSLKAGEIKGFVASNYCKAKVWAGDIKMTFQKITQQSVINLRCILGDIKLYFPQDILINQNSKKTNKQKIENSANADIRAHVSLGGISVKNVNNGYQSND